MSDSTHKEQFDRAFRDFMTAHVRGMRSLREGDIGGLRDAVADECAALERVSALMSDALSLQHPDSTAGTDGASKPK
jgi:hypothetical protein